MFIFRRTKDEDMQILEREQEIRLVRKIVFIIITIVFILFAGSAIGSYYYISAALKPVDQDNTTKVDVTIPIGSSVRTIANILEENGIIKNGTVFRYYVKFKNESGFQAGDYQLSPSMELSEIIAELKTGKVIKEPVFSITIPEGKQLEEIATIISKKTNYSEEEIIELLDNKEFIQQLMEKYPTILSSDILNNQIRHPLEGYLFPATFAFYEEDPTLEEIIEKMISKTEEVVTDYLGQLEEKDMSVHQFLTMASLIEEEAAEKTDREKISAVFYNRLERNMPLQTDPTVLYSLGTHQVQVTYVDTNVDSPYNTYQIVGLPPGPIASPGQESMDAALYPADVNYLYFYSRPNGETIFTYTLEEHNDVKNKYKHEWYELTGKK